MTTIEFIPAEVKIRLSSRIKKAQSALDIQVLKDSNAHIPQTNERTLMTSGAIASGGGEVTWDTPYARRQYYLDEKVKDPSAIKYTTPGTRYKWFEWAKATSLKVWEEIANRGYSS